MDSQDVQSLFPAIFHGIPGLIAAESTRLGGVSPAPYDSLNLGKSTDDAPENVQENRRRFCQSLGFSPEDLAFSFQVHEDQILHVTSPGANRGYDALITQTPGILLAVSIADCVPILLFDSGSRAVAAIHAGWKGTAAKIVQKTIAKMQESFGTKPGDCYAHIGACIDECSFEVGPEVAQAFDPVFCRWDEKKAKHFVDLKAANRIQCLEAGIPDAQIGISPYSTVLNNDLFFSHRKNQGLTGRMMAVIALRTMLK